MIAYAYGIYDVDRHAENMQFLTFFWKDDIRRERSDFDATSCIRKGMLFVI